MKKILSVTMSALCLTNLILNASATDVLVKKEKLPFGVVRETYQDGDVVTFYPEKEKPSGSGYVFKEIVSKDGKIETYYYPSYLYRIGDVKIQYPDSGNKNDVKEILMRPHKKGIRKFFNGTAEEFECSIPRIENYNVPNVEGDYDIIANSVSGSIKQDSIIISKVHCRDLRIEKGVTVIIKDSGQLINIGRMIIEGNLVNEGEFINDGKCRVLGGQIINKSSLTNNGHIKHQAHIENSGKIKNNGKIEEDFLLNRPFRGITPFCRKKS